MRLPAGIRTSRRAPAGRLGRSIVMTGANMPPIHQQREVAGPQTVRDSVFELYIVTLRPAEICASWQKPVRLMGAGAS